jgi:hypothetical protein
MTTCPACGQPTAALTTFAIPTDTGGTALDVRALSLAYLTTVQRVDELRRTVTLLETLLADAHRARGT